MYVYIYNTSESVIASVNVTPTSWVISYRYMLLWHTMAIYPLKWNRTACGFWGNCESWLRLFWGRHGAANVTHNKTNFAIQNGHEVVPNLRKYCRYRYPWKWDETVIFHNNNRQTHKSIQKWTIFSTIYEKSIDIKKLGVCVWEDCLKIFFRILSDITFNGFQILLV